MLLQQGKGGDMASAFGGGGSQTAFGARAGATVLTRATTVLGVLFMLGAIVLGVMGQRGPGSLMRRLGTGPAPVTTPAPAPTPRSADADTDGAGGDASGDKAPAPSAGAADAEEVERSVDSGFGR